MWSKEKINDWYAKQPWIVGFNYLPSNAVNSTEMWQKETFSIDLITKELQAAADIGFNTCRVFMQYIVWKADSAAFFACFDAFLQCADKCGIRVMPILFDDCAFAGKEPYLGVQDDPTPGIHNSGWTPSPGFANADRDAEQPLLKEYVTSFVGRYREDPRIILWDLYNEPGNSNRCGRSVPLLRNLFMWARSCRPTQPLTSGVWAFQDYDMVCAELSDLVSFHEYNGLATTHQRVVSLSQYGRPLLCTEWLHRPYQNLIETHMPYFREQNIGIVNWGMIAGKTQTYLDWRQELNPKEGMPELWQHDILHTDLTPYRTAEVELIRELTGKGKTVLEVPAQEMTPEIMDMLEQKGLIIRLCPSHHRVTTEPGSGKGEDVYAEPSGGHKLLAVAIDRPYFAKFGIHDQNEEVLLLGGMEEKDLYFLFGLAPMEVLLQKQQNGTLSVGDFICLKAKYNDPEVSFFTVCKGALHGEATGGGGLPATFYVTESTNIQLEFFPWDSYSVKVVK